MHKFWMLGAIDDVLRAAIGTRLAQEATQVDVAQCREMFMALLTQQGAQVLKNDNHLKKFAKIFVMILVLDNLQAD